MLVKGATGIWYGMEVIEDPNISFYTGEVFYLTEVIVDF